MTSNEIVKRIVMDKRTECVPCFYLAKIMLVLGEILNEEVPKDDDEPIRDAELFHSQR